MYGGKHENRIFIYPIKCNHFLRKKVNESSNSSSSGGSTNVSPDSSQGADNHLVRAVITQGPPPEAQATVATLRELENKQMSTIR